MSLPTARASGVESLEIIVDSHERYAWKFSHQQASTVRRALHAGDYAIEHDGRILAGVERKSLADLVATITGGSSGICWPIWPRWSGPRSSWRTGTRSCSNSTGSAQP